jgi:CubicO group peptidase (beta-lactamase class C family)
MMLGLIAIAVLAFNVTCQSSDLVARLNSAVEREVSDGFRGSVFFARDGQVMIDGSYGLEKGRQPVFWLASNSKPILAIAIMKLMEQGRVSLDDQIGKYFNNVPLDKKAITIRNLLTHTSGLPHVYVAEGITDRDEAVKAVMALDLEFKISEGWHYANTNYYLLAAIVEIASGRSFETFLDSEVFKPAGMSMTGCWGFEGNTQVLPPLNPAKMNSLKQTIFHNGKSVANWGYRGATGLFTTVDDLHKLTVALRAGKIISAKTLELMWSPSVFIRHDPNVDVYSGLGWYVEVKDGKRVAVRHFGSEEVLGHNGVIRIAENGDELYIMSDAGERNGTGLSVFVARDILKII